MFTGIIQNLAKVTGRQNQGGQVHFSFQFARKEKRKLELGESIAINGVCLTVVKITPKGFESDAVRETLQATTLGTLVKNEWVNTERALRYGDAMGGHFVSGHVDGRGKILKIEKNGKNLLYYFGFPPELAPFIAGKGSVVIDGISLTVQKAGVSSFAVTIIPYTWKETTFRYRKAGDQVNLEVDLIARYLHRVDSLLRKPSKSSKHMRIVRSLKQNGF